VQLTELKTQGTKEFKINTLWKTLMWSLEGCDFVIEMKESFPYPGYNQ
jgi:hypothetical protein